MIKKSLIYLSSFLLCAFSGVAWYFSSQMLYLKIRECSEEHYVFCGDPSSQGIAFEEVSFNSSDGLAIPGWYMPSTNAQQAILLVHGRGASRREGMRYAKAIIDAGYSVLAIDMRHPRQNHDIISTMGYHEKKDVVAALDYLEKSKGIKYIGVMGFSMGAATSIIVMAKDSRIKAGVFNGSYANVPDVLAEGAKKIYGLPRYPLMPVVQKIFEWRGSLDIDEINPEKYVGQISPRPVYIMHGTADTSVDFHHGQRLFELANEPKQFWKAEGGRHTRLWQLDKHKAETSVVEFFNHYLLDIWT